MHLSDDTLSALVDGQAAAAEQAAARTHLGSCVACRARLAEMEALVRLLRALPEEEPPRPFVLGPRPASPPVRRLAVWYGVSRAFVGAAAALFLVLVAANVYLGGAAGPAGAAVAETAAPAAAPAVPAAASPARAAAPAAAAASARSSAAGQAAPTPAGAPAAQAPAAPATDASRPSPPYRPGGLQAPLRLAATAVGGLAVLGLVAALLIRHRLRRAQAGHRSPAPR